jgi:hypothetical protein
VTLLDWAIIALYFVFATAIGIASSYSSSPPFAFGGSA